MSVERLRRGLYRFESWLDRKIYRIRRTLGWTGAPSLHVYREFGTPERLGVHGRALMGAQSRRALREDSWFRNGWSALRALASDEIPGAAVRAELAGKAVETKADAEGYFRAEVPGDGIAGWREVLVELTDPFRAHATAEVFAPGAEAQFGVISDFDDTVIVTEVPRPLRMLQLLLFHNAYSREAVKGAADLYRALEAGPDGRGGNPVFYVSSGSWNFYPMMEQFLDHNGFPKGPILLRDIGLEEDRFLAEGNEHKLAKIDRILKTYPSLPFLLIGDSGQDDPQLYAETLRRHPGRIRAIYIRDVSGKRREAVSALAEQVNAQGLVMRLFAESSEAEAWAREAGWIA